MDSFELLSILFLISRQFVKQNESDVLKLWGLIVIFMNFTRPLFNKSAALVT